MNPTFEHWITVMSLRFCYLGLSSSLLQFEKLVWKFASYSFMCMVLLIFTKVLVQFYQNVVESPPPNTHTHIHTHEQCEKLLRIYQWYFELREQILIVIKRITSITFQSNENLPHNILSIFFIWINALSVTQHNTAVCHLHLKWNSTITVTVNKSWNPFKLVPVITSVSWNSFKTSNKHLLLWSWCPVPPTNVECIEDSNTSDNGHLLDIFAKIVLNLTHGWVYEQVVQICQ